MLLVAVLGLLAGSWKEVADARSAKEAEKRSKEQLALMKVMAAKLDGLSQQKEAAPVARELRSLAGRLSAAASSARESDFRMSDFSRSNFESGVFTQANFRRASFQGADLRGANLGDAIVDSSTILPRR
jgi:uncharacterized protein YjbI with pentapeptide repeats